MTSPAPGWYPDPASPENVRWWDGAAWTHHVQANPLHAQPQPQPVPIVEPSVAVAEPHQPVATQHTQHVGDELGAMAEVVSHGSTQIDAGATHAETAAAGSLVADPLVAHADAQVVQPGVEQPIVPQDPAAQLQAQLEQAQLEQAQLEQAQLQQDQQQHPSIDAPQPLIVEGEEEKKGRKGIELGDVPRNVLIGGASILVGIVSLLVLPWMSSAFGSAKAFDSSLPWMLTGGDLANGTGGIIGHGLIYVLLLTVGAAALAGRLPNQRIATLAVGGVILVLTVLNYLQFSGSTGDVPSADLAVGMGVYAMLSAGLGFVIAGFLTTDEG